MILSEDKLKRILTNAKTSYDGKDLYAKCPKCGHNEFGISLVRENNPFNCFRKKKCGWEGNAFDLMKYLGIELPTTPVNLAEMSKISEKEEEVLDIWIPEMMYPIGWKRVMDNEYLNVRGFTPEMYERYEVGVMLLQKNYVNFAVHMNHKLVGYVGRAVHDWVIPKYKNSITDFGKSIYGYDDIKQGDTVVVGEGAFDKIAIDMKLRLPNHVGIATFGGKFTNEQIELLKIKDVKKLYLIHESDILDKVKKTAIKLSKHFDTKICYTPKGKDPDTMTIQELEYAYHNAASSIDFNLGYMKNGLQK